MSVEIEIRKSHNTEKPELEKLYPEAFPDEDLLPVLTDLLREEKGVLSFVGTLNQEIISHIAFTLCSIPEYSDQVALLAPLCVTPKYQRSGIGSAMVNDGFNRLKDAGLKRVYVLGDPAYYGRFGFVSEGDVRPPYTLPKEWSGAWQSVNLNTDDSHPQGKISLPSFWLKPELWMP